MLLLEQKPHMAMAVVEEELSESDVMWPEARHDTPLAAPAPGVSTNLHLRCSASSRPVDIPGAARLPLAGRAGPVEEEKGVDGQDGGCCGDMVPPHVMVSRRRRSDGEAAVAFSLRSGTGRARRDLSHLRYSVLRMTGFIEG